MSSVNPTIAVNPRDARGAQIAATFDIRKRGEDWIVPICKVLCHNLCVLVMAIYELGIEPVFWQTSSTSGQTGDKVTPRLPYSS